VGQFEEKAREMYSMCFGTSIDSKHYQVELVLIESDPESKPQNIIKPLLQTTSQQNENIKEKELLESNENSSDQTRIWKHRVALFDLIIGIIFICVASLGIHTTSIYLAHMLFGIFLIIIGIYGLLMVHHLPSNLGPLPSSTLEV